MSEIAPSYDLTVHPRAQAELDALHPDVADDLRERLREAARSEQPSELACIKHVQGEPGLLRVRGDGVRAICALDKPELRVGLVGKRRTVYDRLDVAVARLEEGETDG